VKVVHTIILAIAGQRDSHIATRAEHMQKHTILYNFIEARITAQQELIEFLGTGPEVARCILQSQVAVYDAMTICAFEEVALEAHHSDWMLAEAHVCHLIIHVIEGLESYLASAKDHGVLSGSATETMVEPLTHALKQMQKRLRDLREGLVKEPVYLVPCRGSSDAAGNPADLSKAWAIAKEQLQKDLVSKGTPSGACRKPGRSISGLAPLLERRPDGNTGKQEKRSVSTAASAQASTCITVGHDRGGEHCCEEGGSEEPPSVVTADDLRRGPPGGRESNPPKKRTMKKVVMRAKSKAKPCQETGSGRPLQPAITRACSDPDGAQKPKKSFQVGTGSVAGGRPTRKLPRTTSSGTVKSTGHKRDVPSAAGTQ